MSDDKTDATENLEYNFVCSIFELYSNKGFFAPTINIRYDERDTGNSIFINGGGTRLYINRVGNNLENSIGAQAADSHFIVDRIISCLLVSGAGLFWANCRGRLLLETPVDTLRWQSQVDLEPFYSERVRAIHEEFDYDEFGSWFRFVSKNTPTRRALHDAVQAIKNPVEAFVYIYRGFEWLKNGLNLSWDQMARDVGVSTKQLKEVGKIANDETGVRHASKSGVKIRASFETYSTWIAGLMDAIESARARIDDSYTASSSQEIAVKLKAAMQYDPYP